MSHAHDSAPPPPASVRRYVRAALEPSDDLLGAGFVGQRRLADLLFHGRVRRVGGGRVECAGTCYDLVPAVRLIASLDAEGDELVGIVESVEELLALGGFVQGNELTLLGSCYRVERGVIAIAEDRPTPLAV
jgi:hypothetical protein